MKIHNLLIAICMLAVQSAAARNVISLAGQWDFGTTADNVESVVTLPGTLDTNGIGKPDTNATETTRLSRKVTYSGPAYYSHSVQIPRSWKDKAVSLTLERTRPSVLYVDGRRIGSCTYLSAPHRYDLTGILTPGEHRITVMVDNGDSIPPQIRDNSHSCTESTQTNWNGIVGRIELEAAAPFHIESVETYPDVKSRSVTVKARFSKPVPRKGLVFSVHCNDSTASQRLAKGVTETELVLRLGPSAGLWSHRNPVLHRLTATIEGTDTVSRNIALREFGVRNRQFTVNDTTVFLRGRHDACVFPLTGYAPMDTTEWLRYFRIIKNYGLNHVRFHSWTPPAAAFEAADIEGIYLQPELTIWGTFDENEKTLMDFLLLDGDAIQHEYSQHPSFTMFGLGNELWGEVPLMQKFTDHFREYEPRHLYTFGSNAYLGWQGNLPGQDFFVTCRVGGSDDYSTHTRASFSFADAYEGGYLNNTYPNTEMNFEGAVQLSPVPVIGHETGQYQIYPDYREISKYTGVLEPRNLRVFRERLEKAGMADQATDFFRASGLWATQLYLADMEMNLRTPSMAGFQLLDIQDYPGQGTALVGILDAFMDSKGLISPERWRQSCADIVALAEFPTFVLTDGTGMPVRLAVANYSGHSLAGHALRWSLTDGKETIASGKSVIPDGTGLVVADSLNLNHGTTRHPRKLTLSLEIPSVNVCNSYNLWSYPPEMQADTSDIYVSRTLSPELFATLKRGGKVLLMPDSTLTDSVSVGPLFQTDYWNYRMFNTICESQGKPSSPGTLGILADPEHPALSLFPNDGHTDWQWYSLIKSSRPIILDRLNAIGYKPIVQVIDNVERNHRLGLLMEFAVGPGRLLVLAANPGDRDAAARAFMASITRYMNSPDFAPTTQLTPAELTELLTVPVNSASIESLHNISY